MLNNHQHLSPLISKTASGDHEAFEQLILSQKRIILFIIRGLTDSPHDAEDISQEVAIRIFQCIGSLRRHEAFSSWLHTLVVRESMRHLSARNPASLSGNLPGDEIQSIETDSDCLPSVYIELIELRAEIRIAFRRMPKTLREVAALHYLRGMRYREIADMLNMTNGTVSAYLFRARKRLREVLPQR